MTDLPETLKAFSEAAADVVAKTVADLRKEAARQDEIRALEHRAFMAEQREYIAGVTRDVEDMRRELAEKIASVKDGVDGKDGRDGIDGMDGRDGVDGKDGANGADGRDGADADMDSLREHLASLVAEIPVPKDGKDGKDGRDGVDGKDAYPGEAKGLYDPESEYRARDVVMLNGSSFMAKSDDPGECPGDGWMLLAQRGKSGKPGERGERGLEGKAGKDGAQPIELRFDEKDMKFLMVLDDGNLLDADFYPVAKAIRGDAN